MNNVIIIIHTAEPSKPREVTGNVQNIQPVSETGAGSVVSMNWLPPENQNDTAIEYYNLTLYGSDIKSTLKVPMDASLPYKVVLPEGKFLVANLTAVDMCGQRSEPAITMLKNTSESGNAIEDIEKQLQEQKSKTDDVGAGLGVVVVLLVIGILVLVVIVILLGRELCIAKQARQYSTGNKSSNGNK